MSRTPRLVPRAAVWLAFALGAAPEAARAQNAAPAAPSPAYLVGVEERVRTENWTDLLDFDAGRVANGDKRHQWRLRTRVWGRAPLTSAVDLWFGLNDESRLMTTPHQALRLDEILCEQLYLDARLGAGDAVRLGRQNVMRDDGFILCDGTPGDGSRTAYSNGVVWTHAFDARTRLELLGLSNPWRELYLPLANDRAKALAEANERLYGFYLATARGAELDLRAYALRKEEQDSTPPRRPYRHVELVGGRVVRRFAAGWCALGEFAREWGGEAGGVELGAWGAQVSLRRTFGGAAKPAVVVGWVGLSGDDPATTARREGWIPPMNRWPKWSELYIYTLVGELGSSWWTNLTMWQIEATCAPSRRIALRAAYNRLGAPHPFAGPPDLFGSGTTRGDLLQARLDCTLGANLKGHLVYERLWPGDFYSGRDAGEFLRLEIAGSWQKSFPHKGLIG